MTGKMQKKDGWRTGLEVYDYDCQGEKNKEVIFP